MIIFIPYELEKTVKDNSGWTKIAQAWDALGYNSSVKNCMTKAEDIKGSYDWRLVGLQWYELGCTKVAERWLSKAEGLAEDTYDWGGLTRDWKRLGNRYNSVRCQVKEDICDVAEKFEGIDRNTSGGAN